MTESRFSAFLALVAVATLILIPGAGCSRGLDRIEVAPDGRSFVLRPSGQPFIPWGVNYDHDAEGRLIEDYWDTEWTTVEEDFREIKALGANVVRVHLQFGRFMESPDRANDQALDRLDRLLDLAQETGLYLDLTGLGCYHKADVPAWYDRLDERQRWNAQARFWEAIAARGADHSAVFCYDLMNEPVVPGGRKKRDDWLGPAFAGKHFVQFIALEARGRPRHEIAAAWIAHLHRAIRRHDRRHLLTVGLVPWSLPRPGLTSGFEPAKVSEKLDFIAVHIYPKRNDVDDALETLAAFDVGKPIVIEEIFPLKCRPDELVDFIERSRGTATGWISFYWGKMAKEYDAEGTLAGILTRTWLNLFAEMAGRMKAGKAAPR